MNRMVKFITTKEEIKGEVLSSLSDIRKNNDSLVGWVKADSIGIKAEEYTLLVNFMKKRVDNETLAELQNEAFRLNQLFFPTSKSTPTRPVLMRGDEDTGKIIFIIKTPNLFVAEQRRIQFESILSKYDCLISVELGRFKGFNELEKL